MAVCESCRTQIGSVHCQQITLLTVIGAALNLLYGIDPASAVEVAQDQIYVPGVAEINHNGGTWATREF